ncbi:hypothetical protein [Cohnella soli]|uniref:Uncharacterized protein n=1 Tax=Cohnella soli TaxID=425005 RepID=A0ABW0HTR7_9BACL
MKKTEAVPGKPIVLKLREDEEDIVCKWLNLQSAYSDSLRYLIQQEIAVNGLRNLQQFIPQHRTVETLKSLLQMTTSQSHFAQIADFQSQSGGGFSSPPPSPASNVVAPDEPLQRAAEPATLTMERTIAEEKSIDESTTGLHTAPSTSPPNPSSIPETASGTKRSAAKKFSDNVLESYSN